MAIISYKYKFIYSLAPRTASTATADYLIKKFDAEWIPEKDILSEKGYINVDRKHSTFSELIEHEILPKKTVKDFLTFVTVRNPFDSLYSAWYKKRETYVKLLDDPNSFIHKKPGFVEDMQFIKSHTFSEWIIKNYASLAEDNVDRHLNGKFLHYSDRMIRFESLNSDFEKLLDDFEIPYPGNIPVINKTQGRSTDYSSFYSKEAREIIVRAYSLDLQKFGYSF